MTETENELRAVFQLAESVRALEQSAPLAETRLASLRQETGQRIQAEIQVKLDEARQMYTFLGLDDCYAFCEAQNPELFASASQEIVALQT